MRSRRWLQLKVRLRGAGYIADDKISTCCRHFCTHSQAFHLATSPAPSIMACVLHFTLKYYKHNCIKMIPSFFEWVALLQIRCVSIFPLSHLGARLIGIGSHFGKILCHAITDPLLCHNSESCHIFWADLLCCSVTHNHATHFEQVPCYAIIPKCHSYWTGPLLCHNPQMPLTLNRSPAMP